MSVFKKCEGEILGFKGYRRISKILYFRRNSFFLSLYFTIKRIKIFLLFINFINEEIRYIKWCDFFKVKLLDYGRVELDISFRKFSVYWIVEFF